MLERVGSSARDTFVRSTYDMVYMIRATGMIRSQRCAGTSSPEPLVAGVASGWVDCIGQAR